MINTEKQFSLHFDSRTKLLLLFLCVLSTSMAPYLEYLVGLVLLTSLFAIFCNKVMLGIKGFVIYYILYLCTEYSFIYLHGFLQTSIIAFLGLVHKIYPCIFMGNIIIKTTKVSEFLSAMNKLNMPKTISIPFAIMLRYIPTIKEDWRFIKDAMHLRDVSPSILTFITKPLLTLECIYVPMMMIASKTADELSIASMARGIENPSPRTSLVEIRFTLIDFIIMICFTLYFIGAFYL